MSAYAARRQKAIALAADADSDRAPIPERIANPALPMLYLDTKGVVSPYSRQARRQRDRIEAKPPVLSRRLSAALAAMQDGDGLIIRHGRYEVAQ